MTQRTAKNPITGEVLTTIEYARAITESGSWSNKTATGTVKTGSGLMTGFYVNSTTAGTIIFYDAVTATNAITGTITPAVGWHALPVNFDTGLYVAIGGTALDVTVVYK